MREDALRLASEEAPISGDQYHRGACPPKVGQRRFERRCGQAGGVDDQPRWSLVHGMTELTLAPYPRAEGGEIVIEEGTDGSERGGHASDRAARQAKHAWKEAADESVGPDWHAATIPPRRLPS